MQGRTKVALNEPIEAAFLEPYKHHTRLLLFFGYVGCEQVCSPFLDAMQRFYARHEDIATPLVFINLLEGASSDDAQHFVAFFDPRFIGMSLPSHVWQKLQKAFRLYVTTSLLDESVLNHTDYVYVIRRDTQGWVIEDFYFTKPLDEALLYQQLKELP